MLTTNIKLISANSFLQIAAPSSNNSLYLYVGQQLPWVNDASPPTPTESLQSYKVIWNNMIFLKLILESNIQLVIPNITWANNTNYVAYADTDSNLYNEQFYIITSNNEVYKCLANNNGANSTISPIGLGSPTTNYIQTLADGYSWKYMLDISAGNGFIDSNWIPVPPLAPPNSYQDIVELAAVPGSIDIIKTVAGGTNYANGAQQYIIQITGDGTSANAYANVVNNSIENVVMVTTGKNYNFANITTTDPNGSGAQLVAIMPPPGGHGASAWTELGANSIMIGIQTANSENGYFSTACSFRQNGLIVNPSPFGANTLLSQSVAKPYMTLNLGGGVGIFINNELVYQGPSAQNPTFTGNVIDYDTTLGNLRLNNLIGNPTTGTILYGSNSAAQKYIVSYTNPDTQKYTGEIIEIQNLIPVQRSPIQTENFYFVIEF